MTRDRRKLARRLVLGTSACPCGWALAYDPKDPDIRKGLGCWDCSQILLGAAIPTGHPGAVQHTDWLPFRFWEVREQRGGYRHFVVSRDAAREFVSR